MNNMNKTIKFFSTGKWLVLAAIILTGCSSEEVIEVKEQTLSGKYTGSWSSSTPTATFTGVSVSAILTLGGTEFLGGEFFVSSSFVSCCDSGSNDGTLAMNLDGKVITSFSYNDTITDCSGFFNGDGIIRDDGSLLINFTGTDCDGEHTDGVLLLRKI